MRPSSWLVAKRLGLFMCKFSFTIYTYDIFLTRGMTSKINHLRGVIGVIDVVAFRRGKTHARGVKIQRGQPLSAS